MDTFLFASEAVARGHPDKCCDQVSDAILDACLAQDPDSRVAVETTVKGNHICLFGEVTTLAKVNYEQVVRNTLREIGYSLESLDINPDNCHVGISIRGQEREIGAIVDQERQATKEQLGAGDQGLMFGYATDETPEYMPMSLMAAQSIQKVLRAAFDKALMLKSEMVRDTGKSMAELEGDGSFKAIPFWWLRPDAKSQVVIRYRKEDGALVPLEATVVVLSVQHSQHIKHNEYEGELQSLVQGVIESYKMHSQATEYLINIKQKTSGHEWTVGGPNADAGTTGRKIIVDTYGGHGAHGGGAFSGKDPTKVDRSAAYYCRYVAKSLVAAGLCKRVLVQISYVIGQAEPLNIHVDSYGTGKDDGKLLEIVKKNFDFRPGFIIDELALFDTSKVQYSKTAYHGHFGREEFVWEHPKQLSLVK